MASSYEKSVKGATKVKLAAPKPKYIEHLLMATETGAVDQVFRPLSFRLKDSTWTIVFKSLIVAHIMIRDGARDVALGHLAEQPRYFTVSHISQALVSEQGENIRDYARYLSVRVQTWRELKFDYASQRPNADQQGRLKKLSVEKGLLREVEGVSRLTGALLKCKFFLGDLSNDITLTAFRLLVSDLLALFQPLNEGVMNVLSHYFEMSRTDAERALRIYKAFVERTNDVIEYLSEAKSLEHALRLQIPNVKHAPTGLTQALEEYLNDPDFEIHRKQYLQSKERGLSVSAPKTSAATSKPTTTETKPSQPVRPDPTNPFNSLTSRQQSVVSAPAATPAQKQQNLIDFFNSIESEQTSMFPTAQQQQAFAQQTPVYANPSFTPTYVQPVNQYPNAASQQPLYQPQQTFTPQQQFTTPQSPIRPEWTGAGFGGYTPSTTASTVHIMPTIPSAQPVPAPTQFASPAQVPSVGLPVGPTGTGTNPFRASMMPSASTSSSEQSTNPFAPQRSQTLPANLSQPQSFSSTQTSFSSQPQPSTFQQPFQPPSQTAFQSPLPSQPVFQQSNQSQVTFTTQTAPPTQIFAQTGTNPFARPQQLNALSHLTPQVTGTNPFRQSLMPGTTSINGFGRTQ